jgi:hypothetical protein
MNPSQHTPSVAQDKSWHCQCNTTSAIAESICRNSVIQNVSCCSVESQQTSLVDVDSRISFLQISVIGKSIPILVSNSTLHISSILQQILEHFQNPIYSVRAKCNIVELQLDPEDVSNKFHIALVRRFTFHFPAYTNSQ